ncbi:hypothetical protein D515_00628 [Grimontia indica]|uniref:Uncharacterized protein n=1 Tax=Grimontia indica TaxID=1056512 RepID=R1IYD4_9GAMM|nr:hypothetical protein D515_00628 [Grimontia indica]
MVKEISQTLEKQDDLGGTDGIEEIVFFAPKHEEGGHFGGFDHVCSVSTNEKLLGEGA